MMGRVTFEANGATLRPYEDYGVLMVSHDAPPPTPKLYRVTLDGMDGDVDMSEWAGEIRFNSRTVTVALRDLGPSGLAAVTQFLHGRQCKITFSEDPDWYYLGRCDNAQGSTRKRVTNQTFVFTCQPYKLAHIPTLRKLNPTVGGVTTVLQAARKSVIPQITLTEACELTYDGNTYSLTAGTHTVPTFIITDAPKVLTATGSGELTLKWQDGVL